MRSALALVAVALVAVPLVGCGAGDDDESGYPDEAVASFVSECRQQRSATQAACRCVIDRLQVTMPYEEFERVDAAFREDRAPDRASVAKLEAAARGCLGR